MKNKFLVVIDMQNDFCTGALKNDDAVAVIPFIKAQIENARKNGAQIIYTRDTHGSDYMETGEGKHLPVPHCIRDTKGWEIVDELAPKGNVLVYNPGVPVKLDAYNADIIVNKTHFGFDDWKRFIPEDSEVTVVGTCTDICVVSNSLAMKTIEGVEVTVLAEGCAGLTKEKHEHALDVMASCQCRVIYDLAATVAEENKAQEMGA